MLGLFCTAASLFFGCEREKAPPAWAELPAALTVEIATTPEQRERGLMYRQSLPNDHGMYFVFEKEDWLSFYMKDTRIPLTIAFISTDGIIQSIEDMTPLDEQPVHSSSPARFALEVNRGWFEENGIRQRDRVVLEGDRVLFYRRVRE